MRYLACSPSSMIYVVLALDLALSTDRLEAIGAESIRRRLVVWLNLLTFQLPEAVFRMLRRHGR